MIMPSASLAPLKRRFPLIVHLINREPARKELMSKISNTQNHVRTYLP